MFNLMLIYTICLSCSLLQPWDIWIMRIEGLLLYEVFRVWYDIFLWDQEAIIVINDLPILYHRYITCHHDQVFSCAYVHTVFSSCICRYYSSESNRTSFWNVAERRVASSVYLKIDLISEATSNTLFNAPISSDYSDEDDPNSNHQFRVALEAKA